LGPAKSGQLIDKILALDTVPDMRQLRPLLQRG
jgi:hypothetical protein